MKTIKARYADDYHNFAIIEELKNHKGYYDDPYPTTAYRLICYADYDDSLIYHVSIHETLEEAEKKLKKFSCGSFKRIAETA